MAQQSSDDTRRLAAEAWLDDAEADLANSHSLSRHRDEGTAPFAAAFHAEQTVEKGLKSLLIDHGIDYPPKHDLGLLISLLPDGISTPEVPVAGLTVYAVEQRSVADAGNPMNLNERPTWNDAEEEISLAAQALAKISEALAVEFSKANAEEAGQKPG
jgi:HEPN domain-containing protein